LGTVCLFVDQNGIEVYSSDHGRELYPWQQITAVLAHKRDCFSCDVICLAVEYGTGVIEIREESEGWNSLITASRTTLLAPLRSEHGGLP
jgi:hypothetical protein